MAVSGGKGPDDLPGVDGITHTSAQGAEAVGSVDSTDAAARADGVEPAGEAATPGAVDAVVNDLATGRIDIETARALLVEDAVAAQLGPAADAELIAEVRAQIEALIEDDPTLANLLRAKE